MVLTINCKEIDLDETELSNLVSDLSNLASDIDKTLRHCGEELNQDAAQALLSKLNLIANLYS